jgi:hypothetical protein
MWTLWYQGEFFKDDPDKPYSALRTHSLEQSPCYPLIGVKPAGERHVLYYCDMHQEFQNINLSSVEHHCLYKEPEYHKAEVLARLAVDPRIRSQDVGSRRIGEGGVADAA